MKRLVLLGLWLLLAGPLAAQQRTTSPHGDLKLDCAACHQSNSWTSIQVSKQFDHGKYGFPLTGAHGATACRAISPASSRISTRCVYPFLGYACGPRTGSS